MGTLKDGCIWLYTVKQETGPNLPESFNWDTFLQGVGVQEISSLYHDLDPSLSMTADSDSFIVAPGTDEGITLIAPWHVYILRPDGSTLHEWYAYNASTDGAFLSMETRRSNDEASVNGVTDFEEILTPFAFGTGFWYPPSSAHSMVSSLREWELSAAKQDELLSVSACNWTNSPMNEHINGNLVLESLPDGRLLPISQLFQYDEILKPIVTVEEWFSGENIRHPEAMIPQTAERILTDDLGGYSFTYSLDKLLFHNDNASPSPSSTNPENRILFNENPQLTLESTSGDSSKSSINTNNSSAISSVVAENMIKEDDGITIAYLSFFWHPECDSSEY